MNDLTFEVMDAYYEGESLPVWARREVAKFLIRQRREFREFKARATEEAEKGLEVLPF